MLNKAKKHPTRAPTAAQRSRALRLTRLRRLVWRFRLGFAVSVALIVGLVAAFAVWRNPAIIASAEVPVRFFQIATGPVGGTYFPIGQVLASVISKPPGSGACSLGEHCGVTGLIALAKASAGSVANLRGVNNGRIDSALAQSNVANWAFSGSRMFEAEGRLEGLRAIASLYPEAVQFVVRKGAGIATVADLAGKRVAIDRPGTGPAVDALEVLQAFGIGPSSIDLFKVDITVAADMMLKSELDAFVTVGGAPARIVSDLMDRGIATLVPVEGPEVERLLRENPLYVRHTIHAGIYPRIRSLDTIAVKALWVINVRTDWDLVWEITRALWDQNNRELLEDAHAKARLIQLETALDDIPIPLHEGARRFYESKGLLGRAQPISQVASGKR